ncbi:MAG: hypothetical protein JWR80_2294 [Bradyrhizobium sp.]|nr:hypothetical protein [Bradyrhizobium sp.]
MGPCFRRDDKHGGSASIHLAAIKISPHHSTLPRRGRCHGTPPLSETRFWICRRRGSAGRGRRGRAACAATTRRPAAWKQRCASGGHDRRRGRSPGARTGALGPRSSQGMGQAGLAAPRLGLAPPSSLGLSPPLAPSPSHLAPPLLVSAIDLVRGRRGFLSSRFRVRDRALMSGSPPTKNPARAGFCRDA